MKHLYTTLFRSLSLMALALVLCHSAYATTFTVTNLNDSGTGSLRQAIINANAGGAGPHTINFAVAGTITLTSTLPTIANTGITINGGSNITLNAANVGGVEFFKISASSTTIKGLTLQNCINLYIQVAANLSNVTIENIIANSTTANIDNVVRVDGASTNMTIKNLMTLTGMEGCTGANFGRALYFQNGLQTNLTIEDVTIYSPCEGIVFRDASVNNLDIINTTIYGPVNHIVFDNTGGPVETATDVTIDGENTASLYSQADGGSAGMIYSDFVNTTWQIKNLVVDGDRANTADDVNYAIRFDNATSGITIDNVTMDDAEIYGLWFNGAATNINILNSNFENFDGWVATQMIRFESTVTTLNTTNTDINLDQTGTTDDGDYGIVFGFGVLKSNININDLTVNEADFDGIFFDGPATNFTMTGSTFTNNVDGIEFYNAYNHTNLNITNSTFTGHGRSAILINTGSATNSGTISGNTIANNTSNGLWFYSGDGAKAYTVSGNTITANGGAGIYVNAGPDRINITQNSIFKNTGLGIELDGGGNLSYEGANRPTVTGSAETTPGDYNVTFSLPTICNAAGGCTVQIFANASSDDVEGHYYVQEFTGLAAGSHTKLVDLCAVAPCNSVPYGFWTATLKVAATGSVSEFSNKYTMKTQGPAAVDAGIALWLDAQDALSGNLPNGTGWQDRSGLDRDFDLVFGTPNRGTSGLNYNHYVQFNGGSWLRSTKSPFVTGFTAGEVITVTRSYYRSINNGNPYDLGAGNRGEHYSWSNEAVYNSFGTNDRLGWQPSTHTIVDGKPGVASASGTRLDVREWNIFQTYASPSTPGGSGWGTGFNGQFVATTTINTTSFALAGGNEHIGAVSGATFYGDVAEVIMYSRTLTTTERARVNSYLALKYGTTLDQTTPTNYVASDGTGTMWVNDGDAYKWNIFGIGRDNASGLHQKQSESIEQNAILSVGIGGTIAATNEANTATIATDKSFLTFADDNQLQRFGPAVTSTNANFRMHRVWKTDKSANWTDANVTFQFGAEFGGNYLLISPNAAFSSISSEILLDSMGRATFNSSLLAHGSFFTVGAKMQLPGCVTVPTVTYPNYIEFYLDAHLPFGAPVGAVYSNAFYATQNSPTPLFTGYYGKNFTSFYGNDNVGWLFRAKLNIVNPGSYTFYLTSDNSSDLIIDGEYKAGVLAGVYGTSAVVSLSAGEHLIEANLTDAGGPEYITLEYAGPSVARQVIPLSALVPYTAPGVQTWLKADQGVVNSGGVIRWNDVSGNNNDAYQLNAAYNPTYNSGNAINFNPAVTAATGSGMLFQKTIPPTSNLTMFAVGKSASPATRTISRGISADHFLLFDGSNNFAYFDQNVGWKYSGQTITTNQAYLVGMSHNAAANTAQSRLNGKNGTVLTNINEDEVDYHQHFLNYTWQGGNQGAGDVAEFVAVSGTLTATDIQKIESYLALKYGITIDQTVATDYLASNGSTTMWDASDNGIYKNDIAGIGKDLCQNLHQKQSKSVNSDALVTVAVGTTIATTNAANTASVTADNSFLTWGNNDLATTFLTNVTGNPTVNLRMARVWKADKTNWTDGDITLNLTGGNAQNYLVISNADPAFATINQVLQLNASGSVTFNSSLLLDGAFFTFGKRIAGPACVNAGVALWLRADDGTATGALWSDYSGNQKDAVQANVTNQPALLTSGMNYNPAFNFDAAINKFLQAPSVFGTGALTNAYIFLASTADGTGNGNAPFGERINNGQDLNPYIYNSGQVYWDFPFGWRINTAWGGTVGTPNVWTFGRTTALGAISRDGRQIVSTAGNFSGLFGTNNAFEVGRRLGGTYYHGKISEIVVYTSAPSAAEQKRIESYLSLKYGVTLDQTTPNNYVASNGSTIMWDATINSAYKTDIAGIGKDLCTGLHQKQSASVNTGNLITIGLGSSVAASNQANTNAVTNDLSFLVWGHNNLATAFGPAVTGVPNTTARMSRVWKVDKTNTGVPATSWADQNITICAGQTGDRYLLINATDAAFGAGTSEHAMNFSTGCVTINSSLLPDGAFFTLGTKIVGPACVNSGIALWMRADYNGTATSWSDFSGNSRNTTGVVNGVWTPNTTGANFNPYLDNGAGAYYNLAGIYSSPGIVNTKIFAVNLPVSGSTTMPFSERTTNGDNIRLYSPNSDGIMYWDAPFGYRVSTSFAGNGGTYGVPNLFVGERSQTNMAIRLNGKTAISNNAAYTGTFTTGGGAFAHIGANWGFTTYANNRLAEVVVYKDASTMTPVEIQRIESYLALKYGITLNTNTDGDGTSFELLTGTNPSSVTEGDYVAGTTIYWDASAYTGYNAYVAGIGRDDCTDLNQKQSKSVNTGEILTGALGSAIAVSNATNANTITTDNSYLVWGNNNGLNEYTTQVTGTNVTSVLGRVWRVDKTNWTDQNITLCFDNYNNDDYLVISNASASFATINQEKQLSVLGCVTFNSSELPDGAYFSVGKKIEAPGCVTDGIVTWLDAQQVASGNMIDGVGWADKSGNDKYFNNVSSDPARTDAALNYNHVITFDGNDHLSIPTITSAFTQGEVFSILKTSSNAGHAYAFGGQSNNHYRVDDNYENFGTNDRIGWRNSNNIILDGHTGLAINPNIYDPENWNLYSVWSAANDWAASYNGYVKAQTSTNTVDFSEDATNYIGRGEADHLTGDVAEVILYRRKLTAPERRKVMSYLALKYGMTLDSTVTDQDYVAADGTIFWDWSDNNNFQHDVAGIGRDDCQKLNQKQSKSINGDDPLAMAVGDFTTFPTSNEANTTTIADDESFLVWSNNNGTFAFNHTVPKFPTYFRTQRAWKIDKTSFTDQMLTISVAQTGERYLLVDEDGSGGFENDANTKEYAFNFTTGLLNINSSALPDGAVIALGTKISGPGCVNSGIQVWLRSDYGTSTTTDGAFVTGWSDFSGNNNSGTQATAGVQPTYEIDAASQVNYNATLKFDGSNDFLENTTATLLSNTSATLLAVVDQDAYTTWGGVMSYNRTGNRGRPIITVTDVNNKIGANYTGIAGTQASVNTPTPGFIIRTHYAAGPNIVTAAANAGGLLLDTEPTWAQSGSLNGYYVGRHNESGSYLNGRVSEVISYNRALTAAELQQVESYLALKYGVTLTTNNDNDGTAFEVISGSIKEGDYIASNGTTIYWDGSTNTGYNSNVAGIGLDICTELSQKQSKSVNTGEILSGALGSAVQTSNAANTTAFADSDLSFLVWGNNNGTNDFNNTVTATGTTSMAYLGRVWRAQKTNFANQNITLCFTGYDTDEYLLISNSSATFATVNQELQLDANGCITFSAGLLPSGAYFTLGKNLVGPACVDGGIKIWLRADDGAVADSLWADYSGNSYNFIQNTVGLRPVVSTNSMNFNPGLTFTNDDMASTATTTTLNMTNSDYEIIAVGKSTASHTNVEYLFASGTVPYYEGHVNGAATIGWRFLPNNNVTDIGTNGLYANTIPHIFGGKVESNSGLPYVDGKLGSTPIANARSTVSTTLKLGRRGDNTFPWTGDITEYIVYNRALSAIERQKVQSYLALKYGITIDQTVGTDYLASDGSIYWNDTDNTGYGNDIAGLGKDICTNLHQKQSKSVNSDALITMAIGPSVAASNAGNPNTVTNDKSFLLWSNNNLATTFTTNFTKTGFPNVNKRTPRMWKVDKTNWADQEITICVSQAGERYLLVDNGGDGNFLDDGESSVHALSFSTGCVTINSSLLPDGAHFSLGTEISGPACVNNNVKAWYRFDYGVNLNGTTVASLSDYSGNSLNLTESTASRQATYASSAINFNPAGDFTDDRLQATLSGIAATDPITLISVSIPDALSGFRSTIGLGDANDLPHLGYAANDANYYIEQTTSVDNRHSVSLSTGKPYIIMGTANNASPKDVKISYNGTANEQTFSGADGTFTAGTGGFVALGAEPNTYGELHDGYIAEAVVYNKVLDNTEKQKVYSYLGLKYGISLDQTTNTDYVTSNWNGTTGTKMWTNDNDGFETDIAGIGKDECTNLHQKQSASVNTGNIVTVALGSAVQTTNAGNTNTVTNDLSFLTWAHNGGALDFTATATGTNATARLARVWKVDKTNWADQNITVCFGNTYANNYLIINNTDGTFPTVGLEYQLTANGCYTLNSSDLPNGAFFTVGKNLEGPACVNGGIRVWLDANDGLTAITNGFQWNDRSGNNLHVAQTVDGREADLGVANAAHNFNAFVDFDGGDVFETDEDVLLSANSSGSVFFVSQYRDLSGYDSPVDFNADNPHLGRLSGNMVAYMNGSSPIQFSPAALTLTTTRTHLSGFLWNGGTNGGMELRRDALSATDPTMDFTTIEFADDFGVGAYISGAEGIDGTMSEVIVYNRKLTEVETKRVESYLALKYGITMDMTVTDQDYVASDGTNMWDWSDNVGYRNNVAGLGKDDCTNLHQKQSKSVNANTLITVATGSTVAATNAANTTAVTNDKSFFVWSDNGLTTIFDEPFSKTSASSTTRTKRIWKVDKTNWQDQNITICVSQAGERYLLIDNGFDADFDNNTETTEYAFDFTTGCVTINSSLLPDGTHFSLGTKISGPACVNTGIQTWLRADYGATGAQWTDFSGNNKNGTQATVANQPALQPAAFNYNPGFDFDGMDFYDVSLNLNPLTTDPVTLIAVYETDVASVPLVANTDVLGLFDREFFTNGVASNGAFTSTPSANVVGTKTLNIAALDDGPANGSQSYVNGLGLGTFTHANAQGGLTITKIGKNGDQINHFNGRMAEVVIYNAILSDSDRKKVESYLALKYGITLDQTTATDYVASNGTTTMWDASDNAGYTSNIAGIGKDMCTELHQKQSKSVNSGEILSVALGSSVAASNAVNTNTVTNDLSFFTWGNNNGLFDFTETVTATGATSMAYLGRVWKVDKSDTGVPATSWADQDITLCFTGYDQNSYLLVSNSSATFATVNQEFQLGTNGCYTLNSSLIPDGAYFTLGKVQQGPACVDGGIAAWFKIDQGITQSGTISNWADQSGNGVDVAQATSGAQPTYQNATLMNFHPTASYDGGDVLKSTLPSMVGNQPYTIFAIHKPNNVQGNLFAIGNPATNTNIAYFPVRTSTNNRLLYHFNDDLASTPIRTDWQLNTFQYDALTSGTDRYLYDEGKLVTSNAAGVLNLPTNPIFSVGGYDNRAGVDGEEYNGQLVEFVVYEKSLSVAERNRVESYLAFKYGITLDQVMANTNYIASDGTTFMWENDSDNFENDVAGIGKDICTNLHQKQSTSLNTDDIVTFALGSSIAATNAANTNTVTTDKSFFSWANNNGTTATFSVLLTGSGTVNAQNRVARIWKVDKTNWTDQQITICFEGQIGERYLLIDDTDPAMGSINSEVLLDPLTGCITIPSSSFAHNSYFSLGTKTLGPGCADNANVLTWLRADYNATVAQWNDFSGNARHAQQATLGDQPATGGLMNFNPAMDFDGGDFLEFNVNPGVQNLDINAGTADRDPITVLTVYNADITSRPIWGNEDSPGAGEDRYLDMHQVGNGAGATTYTGGNVTGAPKLVTAVLDDGAANGSVIYTDGVAGTPFTQASSTGGLSSTMLGRGKQAQADGAMFDGRIAEFAVYKGALSATNRQKAESFLALKYGITLNNGATDYLASDGSTKMWDAAINAGYANDIAGLGKDVCAVLEQKQSRSANSDYVVTAALGSIVETSNALNNNTIAVDNSYFVWGNNNGLLNFNAAVTGTTVSARLGRVWKVDKTNWDDQLVTLCFNGYNDDSYLITSASPTFATLTQETQLSAGGCVTINTSSIGEGDYFTLGKNVKGPACVSTGVVTWLRADDGTATGAAWNDQSGNDVHATQGTGGNQAMTTGTVNFNPALLFDGTDDYMSLAPLTGLPYGASNRTIVTVGYSTNTVGNRLLFSYGTALTNQANFWGHSGTTGVYGGWVNDVAEANYWANNTPVLTTNTYDGTNATIYKNNDAPTTLARTWSTVQNKGYIGRQVSDLDYWQGGIAEVVVYDRVLSATERQQVNSYLALKYGITLDQNTATDYLASDGITTMWDASDNGAYNNHIAGIGRDDCTNLYQKQSKSVNAEGRVTMGLGTIAATNAANTGTISTDKAFMTWAGNTAGAPTQQTLVASATDLPTTLQNNTRRLDAEWKVDETNTVGNVRVNIDLSSVTITATTAGQIKLLIDSDNDGDFTTGTVDVVTAATYASNIATFNGIDFLDGNVFTLATELPELQLSGKVFLQGPYNTATDAMNLGLNPNGSGGILPTTDPYGLGITASSNPNTIDGIVDWVKIEVRSNSNPTTILHSTAAFVKSDGTLVGINGTSTTFGLGYYGPGDYHIAIRHRNHLGVMTGTALTFAGASATASVDFTVASPVHGVYGTHARREVETGVWAMWAGDVNADGVILSNSDPSDVINVENAVLGHVGNTGFFSSGPLDTYTGFLSVYNINDVNMDGMVFSNADPSDALFIQNNVLAHPNNTGFFGSGPLDTFTGLTLQVP